MHRNPRPMLLESRLLANFELRVAVYEGVNFFAFQLILSTETCTACICRKANMPVMKDSISPPLFVGLGKMNETSWILSRLESNENTMVVCSSTDPCEPRKRFPIELKENTRLSSLRYGAHLSEVKLCSCSKLIQAFLLSSLASTLQRCGKL